MNEQLPGALAERLKQPLPGARAQASFQPELSYGRHFGPAPVSARQAAVLVLLYPKDGAWHIPLTLRPPHLLTHANQISLPGGLIEPGERSQDAALRELSEELGTPAEGLELLGELSPIYLFVSNYWVISWVAVAHERPTWRPSLAEVAEVLEMPVAQLVRPATHPADVFETDGVRFMAPSFTWGGHRIWGATSMILAELVAVLREIEV